MGWTSYHATYYKKGTVDRKAECDAYWMEGLNRGHFNVLKSSMVGSVYYGAIESLKKFVKKDNDGKSIYEDIPKEERKVFGVVFLTSVDMKDYFNFYYKDMDETMMPCYYNCPKSILKLLSDTDNENALEWRSLCYENIEKKKNTIGKLPIGTKIEITKHNGDKVVLKKYPPSYQFKTPFWVDESTFTYMSKKRIPKDFKIISQGI